MAETPSSIDWAALKQLVDAAIKISKRGEPFTNTLTLGLDIIDTTLKILENGQVEHHSDAATTSSTIDSVDRVLYNMCQQIEESIKAGINRGAAPSTIVAGLSSSVGLGMDLAMTSYNLVAVQNRALTLGCGASAEGKALFSDMISNVILGLKKGDTDVEIVTSAGAPAWLVRSLRAGGPYAYGLRVIERWSDPTNHYVIETKGKEAFDIFKRPLISGRNTIICKFTGGIRQYYAVQWNITDQKTLVTPSEMWRYIATTFTNEGAASVLNDTYKGLKATFTCTPWPVIAKLIPIVIDESRDEFDYINSQGANLASDNSGLTPTG